MISKSLVRRNIVANMIGNGWSVVLSIAFVPFYIHFMGIEAYGLVGFFITLQSLFAILDIGLTSTVSRELARLSTVPSSEKQAQNLVRTLEIIYWTIAVLIILIITFLAPWISTKWLDGNQLSADTIQKSVIFMGIIIALRMPYGFYCGGLLGLQKQVLLNSIKIFIDALKSGGAVLVLWLISSTIIAFFLWQLIISIVGAIIMFFVLWRSLPKSKEKPIFQPSIFIQLWRFMAGMSGIAILSVILVETDKLVLSKMLSLEEFAYYALASMVAMGMHVIIVPIFSAVYPRLTQLVSDQDYTVLKSIYHKSCQFMTVLVMPLALVVSLYSETLLQVWTQDVNVSSHSAPLLSLLIIGTAFNAMMNIPYALQLAHGWTKLSIYSNVIAIIVIIPMLLFMISRYGAIGAAIAWLAVNTGYILFILPIVHAKLMKGEFKKWLISDFGIPVIVSLSIIILFWRFMPTNFTIFGNACWALLTWFFSLLAAAFATSATRKLIIEDILNFHLLRL